MKSKREVYAMLMIVAFAFVTMLILTGLTPICIDDFWFLEYTSANPLERWKSALFFYQTHTGRMISQELWLFVLAYPAWVYNLLNPLMFTAFAVLIYQYIRIATGEREHGALLMAIVYLSLWFFTPTFGGIYLWRSASCSYLWMIVFAMASGLPYYAEVFERNGRKQDHRRETTLWWSIAMFLLGILGGWGHEEISATLCVGIITYLIYHFKIKEKISFSKMAGVLGIFLGTALLILDPANFARAGSVTENKSVVLRYGFRIARESFYALRFMTIPFGLACILLWCISHHERCKNLKESFENNKAVYFLLALTIASIYVMTFSAGFAHRIFITPTALLTVVLGIECSELLRMYVDYRKAFKYLMCIFGLACMIEVFTAAYTGHKTGKLIYRETIYDSSEHENIFNR